MILEFGVFQFLADYQHDTGMCRTVEINNLNKRRKDYDFKKASSSFSIRFPYR